MKSKRCFASLLLVNAGMCNKRVIEMCVIARSTGHSMVGQLSCMRSAINFDQIWRNLTARLSSVGVRN